MKYSTEKGEPGYDELQQLFARGARLKVLFNGKEQTDCVFADDEQGKIIRYIRINGKLQKERGIIKSIALYGDVKFEVQEKPSAI